MWTIGNEEAAWQWRGVQTGDTALRPLRRHQNMSWDLHFSRASIGSKALNDFTTMITNLFFIIHWQNINSHWEANGSDCHRNNQLSMGRNEWHTLVQHGPHRDKTYLHISPPAKCSKIFADKQWFRMPIFCDSCNEWLDASIQIALEKLLKDINNDNDSKLWQKAEI